MITVVARGPDGAVLARWRARGRWVGPLPARYHGSRAPAAWTWSDRAARDTRLHTRSDGTGGEPVERWAAQLGAATVDIVATAVDDAPPDDDASEAHADPAIVLTGSRRADELFANKAAGLERTPRGCTWHHVEDEGTEQEWSMATSWVPFAEPGPRVTKDDVRRFEREFGHELPADYREFLLEVNGGYAPSSHCVFTLRRRARQDESILNTLFSLNAPDDQDDLGTAQKHYSPDAQLPKGFLEIGYDGMGGRIILPLVGAHRGEVWYLDAEDPRPTGSNPRVEWFDRRDVWKLADSFAEFMANLKPLDAAS